MKKTSIFLLFVVLFLSCNEKKGIPNVTGIKVNLTLERFDRDFFGIDSNNIIPALGQLQKKYPSLTPVFLKNILGLDSASVLPGVKQFIQLNQPVSKAVNETFKNPGWLEKEFREAFQYVLYYFPDYILPGKIITVTGPVDALAQTSGGYSPDFLGPGYLGISLQFYLGSGFPLYSESFFIEKVAPLYRSRRFSREYITADALQLIVDDIFPDRSNGKSLIEQMIEKGKQWWLLDKFLPQTADSLKTGYTQKQLDWCRENEGLIWSYVVKNEDLNSINPVTIQTYIGESPFTQGFSQELSPGNIGQWIGREIVKKFASANPGLKPGDIMLCPAKKILEEAKYRPK